MNGRPFTGGTIPYRAVVDVTNGRLTLRTDTGTLDRPRREPHPGGLRAPPRHRPEAGRSWSCASPAATSASARSARRAARRARPATIVRQLWGDGKGQLPDAGRYSVGDRSRHELAHRRPLRRDAHPRRPRRDPGERLPAAPAGHAARRPHVPRQALAAGSGKRRSHEARASGSSSGATARGPIRTTDQPGRGAEDPVDALAHRGLVRRARRRRACGTTAEPSSTLDVVVVRPAARAVVLPVPAERRRHRRAGHGRVGPVVEPELGLVHVRLARGHRPEYAPRSLRRRPVSSRTAPRPD